MTRLEKLVERFISGELDKKMRARDMHRILIDCFGYQLKKKDKKNSHRRYTSKGRQSVTIIIEHPGSGMVKDYSVREARSVLEYEGLI